MNYSQKNVNITCLVPLVITYAYTFPIIGYSRLSKSVFPNIHLFKLLLSKKIESWYNRKRIHSSLNYRTPEAVYSECENLAT